MRVCVCVCVAGCGKDSMSDLSNLKLLPTDIAIVIQIEQAKRSQHSDTVIEFPFFQLLLLHYSKSYERTQDAERFGKNREMAVVSKCR